MEEQRTYTDIEILEDSVTTLGKLRIPVDMSEEVGNEIIRVWKNLKALLNARIEQNIRDCKSEDIAAEQMDHVPEVISEETVGGETEENT